MLSSFLASSDLSSADNPCKKLGPRSGQIKLQADQGPNWLTLSDGLGIHKIIFEIKKKILKEIS